MLELDAETLDGQQALRASHALSKTTRGTAEDLQLLAEGTLIAAEPEMVKQATPQRVISNHPEGC